MAKKKESKKDTKSYSYYKDKSTSPLNIPLDYQAENEEKDESSMILMFYQSLKSQKKVKEGKRKNY